MERHCLVVKWDYHYDKEGTWSSTDEGEIRYLLQPNTYFPLPNIEKKKAELLSVEKVEDSIRVELKVEYQTVMVYSAGEPVTVYVSNSYSVCGDSVYESLRLIFSVEPNDASDTSTKSQGS